MIMTIRSLVPLDETLLASLTHGTVVVPSQRLQQACANAFDQHQVASGRIAWRAAHVVTLDDHLESAYLRATAPTAHAPRLLAAATEQLLWRRCAPADAGDYPEVLIDDVAAAWEMAHRWRLWASIETSTRNESHRVFVSWSARFRAALDERCAITTAELPAALTRSLRTSDHWLPTRILTYGFEQTPSAIIDLWDAYRSAGCDVRHHASHRPPQASVDAVVYPTIDAEMRAATQWARSIVEAARKDRTESDLRIGIAIPDLLQRHAALTRRLDATFTPDLLHAQPGESIYNLSGGTPLLDQPIARDALDLLWIATSPMHYRDVHRLVRSPSAGSISSAIDRIGERLPERFDLATLARMTDVPSVHELHELASRWPRRAPIDAWVSHIDAYLRLARWAQPEQLRVGGAEVRSAVGDVVHQLRAHSLLDTLWSARETIAHLRALCARTMFAPHRPDAPVQVLGYLETAGLTFTHLWVTGLDGGAWPAAPRPNPYIAAATLDAAGVPRSNIDSELAYAMATTSRWLRSAQIVRFSCARDHGEEMCSPSPLVAHWRVPMQAELTSLHRPHPYFDSTQRGPREDYDEAPAEATATTLRRRGSALLRDQHACPFQAFARYRLRIAAPQSPHTFPSAIDRGNLLHRVLEFAGRAHIGRTLSAQDIASHIDRALHEWARFPERVRMSERARLERVIAAWLEVEATRKPYEIESIEADVSITIGGIALDLRIDRTDRTPQGVIVIDYKTSRVRGIDIDESQPQLPLYALAVPDSTAVLYAQARSDAVVLRGVVASQAVEERRERIDVDDPQALGASSWEDLQARWRDELDQLARSFLTGEAQVSPREPTICNACDLHAVCRIRAGDFVDA